jgi:hypothetical protein
VLAYLPLALLLFGPALFMLWLAVRQLRLTAAAIGVPREELLPSWMREVLGGAVAAVLLVLLLIIALMVLLRQPLLSRAAFGLPWVFAFALGVRLIRWQRRWVGPGA